MRIPEPLDAVGRGIAFLGGPLLQPGAYHTFLAAYFVVLCALRLWLFPTGSTSDAEVLLFAQSFEFLGNNPDQPPFYSWIVWSLEKVFGPSLGLVVALKYVLLWATHALCFEFTRRITGSAQWGAFAGLGVFGIYHLAWNATLNYNQTVLIAALAMAAVLIAREVLRHARVEAMASLGIVIGIGLATEYSFAIFALAVIGALALDPRGRALLDGPRAFAIAAPALVLSAPHILW